MASNNPNPEWYDDTQAAASQSAASGSPASGAVYGAAPPYRQRRRKLLGIGLVIVGLVMLPRAVFGGHDDDDWGPRAHRQERARGWEPREMPPLPPMAPEMMDEERFGDDMEHQIEILENERERLEDSAEREIDLIENQRDREQESVDREIEQIREQLERDQQHLEEQIEELQEMER